MPAADVQNETDDRFPTGEWAGFFVQPGSPQRHSMQLSLQFAQAGISGDGDDPVGKFTIMGSYDVASGECTWAKHYIGQHDVAYTGKAGQQGIVGQWRIPRQPNFWSGPFLIWPRGLDDMELGFEKAYLKYELSSLFSDSESNTVQA